MLTSAKRNQASQRGWILLRCWPLIEARFRVSRLAARETLGMPSFLGVVTSPQATLQLHRGAMYMFTISPRSTSAYYCQS
jgi:hypothetical protein